MKEVVVIFIFCLSLGGDFLLGQSFQTADDDDDAVGGFEEFEEPAELILPSWTQDDLEALESGDFVPGSDLLGSIALRLLHSDNEAPIELDPAVRDLPDDDPEDEEWSTRIQEQFFAPYFHEMPRSYLTDPQYLLTTQEFRDRESFLNYHARDTEIDLYIYLFDSLQEIPPSESIGSVVRSHIDQDKPVAVVFYFLGMPEKSQLAFSEKVTESVSIDEREKVLRMAVEEALEKSDPSSQLDSFSIQLSIRLYWLEKVVARGGKGISSRNPFIYPETQSASSENLSPWAKLKQNAALYYSLMILGLLFLATLLGYLGRLIAERKRVYIFPDAQGNLLLEAPHAPGVGGVISFSSGELPPARQKSDVPDYLEKM